jgi:hypothetical protein
MGIALAGIGLGLIYVGSRVVSRGGGLGASDDDFLVKPPKTRFETIREGEHAGNVRLVTCQDEDGNESVELQVKLTSEEKARLRKVRPVVSSGPVATRQFELEDEDDDIDFGTERVASVCQTFVPTGPGGSIVTKGGKVRPATREDLEKAGAILFDPVDMTKEQEARLRSLTDAELDSMRRKSKKDFVGALSKRDKGRLKKAVGTIRRAERLSTRIYAQAAGGSGDESLVDILIDSALRPKKANVEAIAFNSSSRGQILGSRARKAEEVPAFVSKREAEAMRRGMVSQAAQGNTECAKLMRLTSNADVELRSFIGGLKSNPRAFAAHLDQITELQNRVLKTRAFAMRMCTVGGRARAMSGGRVSIPMPTALASAVLTRFTREQRHGEVRKTETIGRGDVAIKKAFIPETDIEKALVARGAAKSMMRVRGKVQRRKPQGGPARRRGADVEVTQRITPSGKIVIQGRERPAEVVRGRSLPSAPRGPKQGTQVVVRRRRKK